MGLLRIFRGFTATGSPKVGALEWNADLSYSGELPVSNGGTGATDAAGARTALGLSGPMFSAYRATDSAAIPDGVYTEMLLDAKHYDTATAFNTANGRFTPQVAGYYQFNATLTIRGSSSGLANAQLSLWKNGAPYKRGSVFLPVSGTEALIYTGQVSGVVPMNGSTDYVSLFVYADVLSGAAILDSSAGATPQANFFDGTFIRP